MTLITKPDFTYVWASGGAIVAPNDTKKQLGWIAEAPPFQYDNWLQNRQDQMLAHINQRGIAAWDALTNYEAGGLSYVQGSDGKVYKSVAASGPSSVVSNPTTDGTDTYWTIAFANVGAFLTQAAGDARYAQLSNNLSDLTNIPAARANLGLTEFITSGISSSYSNLKASATGLSATVAITANSICLKNTSNEQVVINSVSLTPSLSVTGANGLDTGTSAANTWYYLWVIWNGTTTAGLFSLSSTSPAMPAGYTHKARFGAVRSDGTGNKYPLSFLQNGNSVQYKVSAGSNLTALPILASGVLGNPLTPVWVAVSIGSSVPTTCGSIKLIMGGNYTTSGGAALAPNNSYGPVGSTTNSPPWSRSAAQSEFDVQLASLIPESTDVYYASNNAQTFIQCFGWEDNL